MPFDALHLARAQFAFTMSFHFVFPAFSIGLASYLAVLEGLWLRTSNTLYLDLFRYWVKIFAVVFGMGVVSGIIMSYQFGTNWAAYSNRAGPIIGPLMAYEVLTAFFLEAGFLGVMLFGMSKVGRGLHFFATCMVALGTLISATWIISTNSWMQTPAGFSVTASGQFVPSGSWSPIIFSASFPYRLVHTVIAAYLTTALTVGGVGAWHLLKDKADAYARKMFSMAMWMAALVAPVQILAGDQHGLNTRQYQPAKVAALEGDWETEPGTPLILFGMPNMAEERTNWAIAVPHLGALVLTHSWNGAVEGLKSFPPQDRPNSPVIFWAFRIMVGLGLLMAAIGVWAAWLRARGVLYQSRWLRYAVLAMAPSGFIALLSGWTVTEVGRQPFTVYGLLRTSDSASPIGVPGVEASLAALIVVYAIVFGTGLIFVLRLMRRPPTVGESGPQAGVPMRSAGITPAAALRDAP